MESLKFVTEYSTKPKESIHYFKPLIETTLIKNIKLIVHETLEILRNVEISGIVQDESNKQCPSAPIADKLRDIMNDFEEHFLEMKLYGGYYAVLHTMLQLESIKTNSDDSVSKKYTE